MATRMGVYAHPPPYPGLERPGLSSLIAQTPSTARCPLFVDKGSPMSLRSSIQAVHITSPEEQARFCAAPDGTPLDPATLAETGADEHWLLEGVAGAVARCSLWWRATPAYQGDRVGLIGHYAA